MELQGKIEYDIMVKLEDLTDRLERVQYALYQTEDPDTRFDEIYEKLKSLEISRNKDIQSNRDLKESIDTQISDTLFGIQGQMRELDSYKSNYDSIGKEIQQTQAQIKKYMDENVERLTDFMSKGDEKLIQIDDRLFKVEKTSTDHKFDIDKLVARANQAFESL